MKTLIDLFTQEMGERITRLLIEEEQKVIKSKIGSETYNEYSEIEILVIADIFNDYMQIPLIEMEEIIKEIYPFINELGLQLHPFAEVDFSKGSNLARATVCHFEFLTSLKELTDEQIEECEQLTEDLMNIYSQLNVRLSVEFEEIEDEEDEEDEEEDEDKDEDKDEDEEDEEGKCLKVIDIW